MRTPHRSRDFGVAALLASFGFGAGGCVDDADDPAGGAGGGAADGPGGGGASGAGAGADVDQPRASGVTADDQGEAPWDWVGIIGTGPSLSVATTPIESTTQPYDNLMLSLGDATVPSWDSTDLALEVAHALSSQGGRPSTASRAVRWGQLRDADPFVGSSKGLRNPSHAVSFRMPVPERLPVSSTLARSRSRWSAPCRACASDRSARRPTGSAPE